MRLTSVCHMNRRGVMKANFNDPDDDDDRIPDFAGLCQQIVECLEWYESWLTDFAQDDDRFDEEIKEAKRFRENIRQWSMVIKRPKGRRKSGFVIFDGSGVREQ
jgi:hypothetical protein